MSSEFPEIVARLRAANSLLCLTHIHPDGDGLGAMAALVLASRAAGKIAEAMLFERIPWRYTFLFPEAGEEPPDRLEDFPAAARRADCIVVLDTSSRSQLGDLAAALEEHRERTVVIDHHETGEDIGVLRWVDVSAAAVGVMTLELITALGWPMELPVVRALATAIVSDTGWLRFSNTDARCLHSLARLVEGGVVLDDLYQRIYQSDRLERVRLLERVLRSLEMHHDGQVAVMTIRQRDFAETGARPEETENLINEALRLASVEVAILLTERPDPAPGGGRIRVSLRSRSRVDVAKLASRFGGGGHARAAGLRSDEMLEALKAKLIHAAAERLEAG